MKKKKEHTPKPKEFSSSPFASLKGVKAEPAPQKPEKGSAAASKPSKAADDTELFLQAMADVRRMSGTERPKPGSAAPLPPVKSIVRKIDEEEQKLFLEALNKLRLDVVFRDELPEEAAEPAKSGNMMRQLRRGTIRIDYELDLHGLSREEALDALEAFIGGAYRRGQKAVLVITGKGNHSPAEPVLGRAVMEWLRRDGKGMVAETVAAPGSMGGEGAVVVFIRTEGRSSPCQ